MASRKEHKRRMNAKHHSEFCEARKRTKDTDDKLVTGARAVLASPAGKLPDTAPASKLAPWDMRRVNSYVPTDKRATQKSVIKADRNGTRIALGKINGSSYDSSGSRWPTGKAGACIDAVTGKVLAYERDSEGNPVGIRESKVQEFRAIPKRTPRKYVVSLIRRYVVEHGSFPVGEKNTDYYWSLCSESERRGMMRKHCKRKGKTFHADMCERPTRAYLGTGVKRITGSVKRVRSKRIK